MLASAKSLEEVQLLLTTSVDIIDLKQPELGALGALSIETVKKIVNAVNKNKPVSATIGDMPMEPEQVFNAALAMANTGVDYIKIGFFPNGSWQETAEKLTELMLKGYKLIAVLFADTQPDFETINLFKRAGFAGVMLDTMDKSAGSLSQVMSFSKIKEFAEITKEHQLLCGLAGSLKKEDVSVLKPLDVDYLGFRGALCAGHNRTDVLDDKAIKSIISLF